MRDLPESYLISSQLTLLDSMRLMKIEVAKRAVAEERQERKCRATTKNI